jgi:hypothetical protein
VRKRTGKYKARWVLRGDFQKFEEFDLDDIEEDFDEADEPGPETKTAAEQSFDAQDLGEHSQYDDAMDAAMAGVSEAVKKTYRQLFSPVLTTVSMMIIFALAATNEFHLYLADVTGAFLQAPLLPEEYVYAYPPRGYENHPYFKGKVIKFIKSIYGLRQAHRRWYAHLKSVLLKHGMTNLVCESCMYVLDHANGLKVKAGTHVDDFLFAVNDRRKFEAWFQELQKDIHIEEPERVTQRGHDYVAVEVSLTENHIVISQRKYIEKALKRFGMENAKPADTPIAIGMKFT